ncbi:dual specificity tyrosine-phosphorylation-regulated kinase 1A [Drosophila willistoni]|uniref:dual specificity tyrosine-phosphorylation-regulated kinase 1A n=1 Tax=Drosophila willistoni TaxID=7260 RepID=UPI000C26C80D|nr:dual specificity tyrosine-phosphorylation-regulated kinase 1A [Drosophila willistoni]
MNRSRITLDLYLEPLNPDGSYRNRRCQEISLHAAAHKNEGRRGAAQQNAAVMHGQMQPPEFHMGSTELSVAPLGGSLGGGGGQYVNFAEPLTPRRRGRPRGGERIRFNVPPLDNIRFTISEAERSRLNFMIPPMESNAQSPYNQQQHQQQQQHNHHHHHHRHRHHHHHHHPYQMPHQLVQSGSSSSTTTAQQSLNGAHSTLNDMMRFYQNQIIPEPQSSGSSRLSSTPVYYANPDIDRGVSLGLLDPMDL